MSKLKRVWERIHALIYRNEIERDMDKEFAFHLDMRTRENLEAGMSEKDARAEAIRRFGSVSLAKEHGRDVRGAGLLEPLIQDLKYGIRTLQNSPGFTVVAVLALALGIGANTAAFSFLDAMFMRPLPFPEPDRLVRFYSTNDERKFDSFSYSNYADVRDRAKSFSGLAAHQNAPVNLTAGEQPERAEAELVTGNYFDVLGITPQLGRLLSPDDDLKPGAHPVTVISDDLWNNRFGSQSSTVGRQIAINGYLFTIVGILPHSFKGTFPAFGTDLWIPLMMHEQVRPRGIPVTNRGWGWLHGTGRLASGISTTQAQADVTAIARQLAVEFPRFNENLDFRIVAARAMREQYSENASRMLLFLMLATSTVLLITCGNIASVLLARAMARRGEIAVRHSLGASRGRLVRQWITESVLLAVFGGVAGLVLAIWLGNAAMSLSPSDFATFSPDFRIDQRTGTFALASAVLAGVLFGLFPALWVRKADVATTLKHEGGSAGGKASRSRLYSVLVGAQVALSVVLLIAAGLLFRSIRESDSFNPGFDTKNLLIADVNLQRAGYKPDAMSLFYPELIERIKALPGIRGMSYGIVVPLGPFEERSGVYIAGRQSPSGKPYFVIGNNIIGPDYFSTMGIPIASGRAFTPEEFRRNGRPVTIVGEAMARQFWPGETAVGKTVRFAPQGPDVEIVGVARDIKYYDLNEAPIPYLYLPFGQVVQGSPIMIIRTESAPDRLIPSIKNVLAGMDSNLTWEHAMDFADLRAEVLMPARAMFATSSIFGIIALLITGIGLYGVISYSVNRRTAEIGVRIAMGASHGDILKMVIKDGIRLTAIGSFVGIVVAIGVTRFLSAQLFGITATDPVTFITVTMLMFVVSVVACYLPARRATKISPTLALKWGQSG